MDGNSNGGVIRLKDIERRLQSEGVPHFNTTVTLSALEIPAQFVRDHGDNMNPSASLRLESGTKVWPVRIDVYVTSERFRVRFCQKWKAFLSGNGLKKGDELIVSLVAKSEFVLYAFKRNLDSRRSSRNSELNGTTSPSRVDAHPHMNARKSTLGKSPSSLSTPQLKAETQNKNISDDSIRTSSVTRDELRKSRDLTAATESATIPDNRVSDTISFQMTLFESSIGNIGNPRHARTELPAAFARSHASLLSDGTVITLEGPMPGAVSEVVCRRHLVDSRVTWRRGWPKFVKRNELRAGDNLTFSLIARSRFSVLLGNSSAQDPPLTVQNMIDSCGDRDSTGEGGQPELRARCTNRRRSAVDPHKNPHFVKTLPAASDPNKAQEKPSTAQYTYLVSISSQTYQIKWSETDRLISLVNLIRAIEQSIGTSLPL